MLQKPGKTVQKPYFFCNVDQHLPARTPDRPHDRSKAAMMTQVITEEWLAIFNVRLPLTQEGLLVGGGAHRLHQLRINFPEVAAGTTCFKQMGYVCSASTHRLFSKK